MSLTAPAHPVEQELFFLTRKKDWLKEEKKAKDSRKKDTCHTKLEVGGSVGSEVRGQGSD